MVAFIKQLLKITLKLLSKYGKYKKSMYIYTDYNYVKNILKPIERV